MDPRCRCDHVNAANGLHCLQSVERGGPAQGEGFAQYFASKVWNDPDESDCSFFYYKETLLESCPPGKQCEAMGPAYGLKSQSVLPPAEISGKTPSKWRNNFCGMNQ